MNAIELIEKFERMQADNGRPRIVDRAAGFREQFPEFAADLENVNPAEWLVMYDYGGPAPLGENGNAEDLKLEKALKTAADGGLYAVTVNGVYFGEYENTPHGAADRLYIDMVTFDADPGSPFHFSTDTEDTDPAGLLDNSILELLADAEENGLIEDYKAIWIHD